MDEDKVDEIVKMLDSFFENGGGHMNIVYNADDDAMNVDTVEIQKGLDNCGFQTACQVPTYHFEGEED